MIRSGFQQQGGLSVAQPTPAVPAAPVNATPSVQDSLDVLDKVLTEVEQARAVTAPTSVAGDQLGSQSVSPAVSQPAPQPAFDPVSPVIPQVVDQATDTLNSGYTGTTAKESAAASPQAVEMATGVQYVETEKSPEIPVEVESYLQKVEQEDIQLPDEIVIADQTQTPLASHYVRQPVIVLPITPEVEAAGASKSPVTSVRWLVEFSRKLMKMFTGKVIYREVPS